MAKWLPILITIGFLLVAGAYVVTQTKKSSLIFSPTQVLGATWLTYKQEYLEEGSGRTLDKQRTNVTTSEGQSYTMLRAVWQGDKATFDQSWQWTKDNLLHEEDWLFAWLFGERPDGSYGVLVEQNGHVTASDADQDIALALVFAYARWQDPAYIGEARRILDDLWDKEVILIAGRPYLAANDLEKFSSSDTAILNPSYLAPYAYRIFALVDSAHPWGELTQTSYDIIETSLALPLDTATSAGLPPNWVRIHKETGEILPPHNGLTTDFGYDALRTPWRITLDYLWNDEPRAKSVLERMHFLSEKWEQNQRLAAVYRHDGTVLEAQETPAMYGGTIGYFLVADPAHAKDVYDSKLASLYNPDINGWEEKLSYYDDNWAWFGIALYHNLLPNLAANLPAGAYLTP